MDIALYMGKLIYSDLVFGNMSGWSYWTAFAQEKWSQKNRFYLIRMNAKGDTGDESYGDIKNGGTVTADKNLWVLGNYSRFVRPGYQRVEVTGADEMNALLGSAWLSPDGKTLVSVLVNMSRSSRKIDLSATGATVNSTKAYVTDKDNDLQLSSTLTNPADMEIPARSVVTVVMGIEGGSGVGAIKAERTPTGKTYSLSGQQLKSAGKGVYIRDGKKIVLR